MISLGSDHLHIRVAYEDIREFAIGVLIGIIICLVKPS